MPSDILWLPLEEAIKINEAETSAEGEPFVLLHRDLLESAMERPKNAHHYEGIDDILHLACILMFAIAANHPFAQGNKRTGWTAGVMFMMMNGYTFEWDSELVALEFKKVITGEITQQHFEEQIYYFVNSL